MGVLALLMLMLMLMLMLVQVQVQVLVLVLVLVVLSLSLAVLLGLALVVDARWAARIAARWRVWGAESFHALPLAYQPVRTRTRPPTSTSAAMLRFVWPRCRNSLVDASRSGVVLTARELALVRVPVLARVLVAPPG